MKKALLLLTALVLLAGCSKKQSVDVNANEAEAQPEAVVETPVDTVVEAAPAVQPQVPEQKPEPVTFKSLMSKYGVYGRLAQYDKALSNKEKKKAKEIEDELYEICKKVKADPTVPESVYKKFRDYIEDEEDRIEDKY
jgi:PBP1b-binding outer membrane lipoprotein LpoB